MYQLLVNDPTGAQLLLEISQTGQYFDQSRVVWDTRIDGKLPKDMELGKMIRENKSLIKSDDYIPAHKNYLEKIAQENQAETKRIEKEQSLKESISKDQLLSEIKDMDAKAIEDWFKANGKSKGEDTLKLVVKVLIKNGLLK